MSPIKPHENKTHDLDAAIDLALDSLGCPSEPDFRHRVLTLLRLNQLLPEFTHPAAIAQALVPWQAWTDRLLFTVDPGLLEEWLDIRPQDVHLKTGLLDLARYYEIGLGRGNRKKSGQFHTPIPLAESLIQHSLKQMRRLDMTQKDINQSRQTFRVLDPACGTGAFLWAANQHLPRLAPNVTSQFYGLDQDPVSLAIAHALLEGSYQPLDSLSLYPDFHEASALKGQMDWVIGNPPYVGEKNNKALFQQLLATHPAWREHYQGKMDYWYFFLYLGLAALKPGGHLLFLTSRYWLTADGASRLRKALLEQAEIIEIIDFEESGWFSDAVGHHSGAFLLKKNATDPAAPKSHGPLWTLAKSTHENNPAGKNPAIQFESRPCAPQSTWDAAPWTAPVQDQWESIFQKMKVHDTPFQDVFWDMQGVISGADSLTPSHLEKHPELEHAGLTVGSGIFCVSPDTQPELFDHVSSHPFLKPYFKGRHIQCHTDEGPVIQFPDQDFLLYLPHRLNALPPRIILNHLEPYRPILSARREVQQGKMPWYALHWPRNESRLNGLSLVTPRRSPINRFALSPSGWFAHSDLTVQGLKNTPNPTASDYQPWLTLFNSPLLNCWMHLKGKAKGKIREFYATPLRQIPLPRAEAWKIVLSPTPSDSRSQEAHSFETHQFETHQFETHQWVCRLYGLSDQEALFVWDSWQKLKP